MAVPWVAIIGKALEGVDAVKNYYIEVEKVKAGEVKYDFDNLKSFFDKALEGINLEIESEIKRRENSTDKEEKKECTSRINELRNEQRKFIKEYNEITFEKEEKRDKTRESRMRIIIDAVLIVLTGGIYAVKYIPRKKKRREAIEATVEEIKRIELE